MSRFFSTAPFSSGVWPIAAIFASAMCAFLFMATPANAATTEGAVISNGTVQLGVNAQGDLNYDCVGAGDTDCPDLSAGSGEQIVGLRYVPLNLDAISPGCQCEGWGLADAGSGLTGSANESDGRLEHHDRQLQRDRDDVDIDGDDLRPLDSGLRDGDRAVLSPVTAQLQPLRGHRHRHEHWRQHSHRPPLPAGDGLGHRADGLRRMGDDSGDLTPAPLRLRRRVRQQRSPFRTLIHRLGVRVRRFLHRCLPVHRSRFRRYLSDRQRSRRSRRPVRLWIGSAWRGRVTVLQCLLRGRRR